MKRWRFFKDLSIRWKITGIAMLIGVFIFLFLGTAFMVDNRDLFQKNLTNALSTLAQVVANNSTAALSFNDPKAAQENLAALRAEPSLIGAAIYAKDGSIFASYSYHHGEKFVPPPPQKGKSIHLGKENIQLFVPILLEGENIGTLYLESSLSGMNSNLWRHAIWTICILIIAVVLMFLLISLLQKTISQPIERLAQIVRQVSLEKDYSVRVKPKNQDELGLLMQGFNEMLERIQARDIELQEARDALEERVKIRTAELRESTSFMQSLLASANYSIISTDLEGTVRTFNPGAERALGYKAEEVLGKVKATIFHLPEEINRRGEELSQELGRPIASGVEAFIAKSYMGFPDEQEWTMVRKDGTCYPALVSLSAIKSPDGSVKGMMGIAADITERKKIEQMKGEFISTVSHELRTPLTSIRGSLGLIAGGIPGTISDQAKMLLQIAINNCERLVRLINDILDIEKIESGNMEFKLKAMELMPLIEQALESNRGLSEKLGINFQIDQKSLNCWVNVDADALIRVMTNLISNAAKFSPLGGEVVVSITPLKTSWVRVLVTDQGPGIPEEFRKRIFQKFAQADSSDTRQKGGTGLGLSIVKAIIEQFGGKIDFESKAGQGTTFYFDLPTWEKEIFMEENDSERSEREEARIGRPKILICEDDYDAAVLLKLMLDQGGFESDIAHSAGQAKKLLQERHYDGMTLDIHLPGQDGMSFLRELRQGLKKDIPVVIVSVKAITARKELEGSALNVIDWIEKPIDQNRLLTAVRHCVVHEHPDKPTILHVEDDIDTLQITALALQEIGDVSHAKSLKEALEKIHQEEFDLVILDIMLPDGSGLEIIPFLRNHYSHPIPIVVFSAKDMAKDLVQQVSAVLIKSRTKHQELVTTIVTLLQGKIDKREGELL